MPTQLIMMASSSMCIFGHLDTDSLSEPETLIVIQSGHLSIKGLPCASTIHIEIACFK